MQALPLWIGVLRMRQHGLLVTGLFSRVIHSARDCQRVADAADKSLAAPSQR